MKIENDSYTNEISTSYNGIPYVTERLSTRKRVYTQARLQKIEHNDKRKIDIQLKLGRYNILDGVETENPKSELTLTNEEFLQLIDFIQIHYKPLELGVEKFIAVEDVNSVELLKKFNTIVKNDADIAQQLLDSGLLSENTSCIIETARKKQAIENFASAIDGDDKEKYWQDWFSKNKWVLGSEYIKILDERKIDTENIADLLMEAFDGFLDIVEIKRPNEFPFWQSSKDHDNYVPSGELIKAITQCQNYLYQLEREANSLKFNERAKGIKIIKPRCLLVFGRSNDWNEEQQQAYRILNASYNQIDILTYDHLLSKAQRLLGIENTSTDYDDMPF